jgi:hypothetical protein
MGEPKRARVRRPRHDAGGATIPDDLVPARSARTPTIPRPPRMPSDSASLPRALDPELDLDRDDILDSFTATDGASPTVPCGAQPLHSERPTVPSPASKTSRVRVR